MGTLRTSHLSVKKQIEDNIKNEFDAFNEYIWNAIDAKAKSIDITVKTQNISIKELNIKDDGLGINFNDLDKDLFGEFNTSVKPIRENISLPHGNRGFGRFAFINFSDQCVWETTYHFNGKNNTYTIKINKNNLETYSPTQIKETENPQGTKVSFIFSNKWEMEKLSSKDEKTVLKDLIHYIALEFCWIIELLGISITVNRKKIDYEYLIEDRNTKIIKIEDKEFEFRYIKWKFQLRHEYSKYYLIDSKGEEQFCKTTTLNNKGDDFYHSLFIKSYYFDDFIDIKTRNEPIYRRLMEETIKFLREKRKPFLKNFSNNKIEEFKKKDLFPKFNSFEEKTKKPIYEEILKEIIEFAPSLVSSKFANDDQRKVLLELVNQLLDDEGSRESLYGILQVLVDDENKDLLEELSKKLQHYGLKNLLGLIKTVERRIEAIKNLKSMVGNNKKYYSESDLQEEIEEHFWIFGEEYHMMICAEETNFTKLRNLYYEKVKKMKKEDYENIFISKKQVDLFICGITQEGKLNKNLIVEIKKPDHYIKKEDLRQVEDYKEEILKLSEFNSPEYHSWNFVLLYTYISDEHKNYFRDEIKDKKTGFVKESENKNFKIFIIKWADLLEEVDFRLKFLKEKLNERRNTNKPKTIEEPFSQFKEYRQDK